MKRNAKATFCLVGNEPENSPKAPPSALLVHEQAAAEFLGGVCVKTLYNFRRRGLLKAVKIGSRTMYEAAELRAFVERLKGAAQ